MASLPKERLPSAARVKNGDDDDDDVDVSVSSGGSISILKRAFSGVDGEASSS